MEKIFLQLVLMGIGHSADTQIKVVDWGYIKSFAERQGLSAVVLDGIERLPENERPPKELLIEWIGEVLQEYEYRYETYCRVISEIAGLYNSHGFKMMVLKGYACSLDWPKPKHRPCGDIDIWLFGMQKEADSLLTKKGINVDKSHHHHTVYFWNGFMVENHFDFINIHHHKSNKNFEKILKTIGRDDNYYVEILGEKVFLPSPNLHALFLFKHFLLHFASGKICLRMLLDWAFFLEKHCDEIDWYLFTHTLEAFGMSQIFNIINEICIDDLGFKFERFYIGTPRSNSILKTKVFGEILHPVFTIEPNHLIHRIIFKSRRWKANEWKHKLCYNESILSGFISGIWNHILKPSSI